ncbi:MAG: hypothetical protein JKY27_13615 [Magnetovibrio sp.]|nr:hypothetical protein [Magnetovibrio sp.]MBL4758720.1 hypothetical protein [Hyphomicrobiales bacterium]
MDLIERRALLVIGNNPDKQLDYLVTLTGHLPGGGGGTGSGRARQVVEMRYVPDKHILQARSFGTYLEALSTQIWDSPEDLAVTVLSDINNEVITRWVQIAISVPELQHHAVETHAVVIEDRQPEWDNPALLTRLVRL